jgi:hypothetical protein
MGLKGYRLWAMGHLESTCRAPPGTTTASAIVDLPTERLTRDSSGGAGWGGSGRQGSGRRSVDGAAASARVQAMRAGHDVAVQVE